MNRWFVCFLVSILWASRSLRQNIPVVRAFHDCVRSRKQARNKGRRRRYYAHSKSSSPPKDVPSTQYPCQGGICVGMTNGPHQGGNASYPLAWNGTAGTRLESCMTVPEYPLGLHTKEDFSQITYYLWTDIFFGDESLGRMNQLVPQLILGSALDGSTGPPSFKPQWNSIHTKWSFGAHYFFEVWNPDTNTTDAHAAYGDFFHAYPGEILQTSFELSLPTDSFSSVKSPAWQLTMSVMGDPNRTSVLTVPKPYMGLGEHWEIPSSSWLEPNFRNLCINSCWELYGASDAEHLPSSGAEYRLRIEQPTPSHRVDQIIHADIGTHLRHSTNEDPKSQKEGYYAFTTWEQDEGNGICPSCQVSEVHTERKQDVFVEFGVSPATEAEHTNDLAKSTNELSSN